MFEFVTGRINGAYTPGSMAQSSQITLPELLGAGMGSSEVIRQGTFGPITSSAAGYGGVHGNFGDVVKANIQANGVQMMTPLVAVPIAFKVVSKLASKPRREFNKLARTVGLPVSM